MQITGVRCWREDLALKRPYSIAYRTVDAVENVFIQVELANGCCGLGAASPAPLVTGEKIGDTLDALNDYSESELPGADIRHFRELLRRATPLLASRPGARAALDMALHDAFTRWLGVPLARYLGQVHRSFPTSVTIGILSPEETVAEAEAFVRQGFRIIKLKTGKAVEADIATFIRLREAVGPDIRIRIDANQGYTADDIRRFAAATATHGVEFFEQPLPPDRWEAMRQLPADLRRRCAADENLLGPADALRLTGEPPLFGIYNIKLMKCGGIEPALRIADIAHLAGIELMWGCNDESVISIAAALHAALACPATRYLDLDGSFDLARDPAQGGFELRNGRLFPLDRPGMGVVLADQT